MIDISLIAQTDPEIAQALEAELSRQQNNIELIASENFVSPRCLRRQALTLPINMRKVIPVTAITAVAGAWI